jgi:PAS domain-containing protein
MLSDDLSRKVVEHSVDGLLVIDKQGIVQFANPAAVALFTNKTKDLVGVHLGAPAIHEPVEVILPGGDGMRYVEMRATEIFWEGTSASLASLRDITERKQTEEALRASAETLRERNVELMRFNRTTVGRELRMIELKEEINQLCTRLGEPPRYRIPVEVEATLDSTVQPKSVQPGSIEQ